MSTDSPDSARSLTLGQIVRTIAAVAAISLLGYGAYAWLHDDVPSLAELPGILIPPAPCTTPITYRLGEFDTRFSITQDYFLTEVEIATKVWALAEGKSLFEYDPKGTLVINLVYDDRQAAVQLGKVINTEQQTYEALKPQYDAAQKIYANAQAEFLRMQDAYNQEVDYWNGHGGAPPAEFDKLARMKADVVSYGTTLDELRTKANQLAAQLNAKAQTTNEKVNTYNQSRIVGTDFDEGVYQQDKEGTRINIYEFTNGKALEHILEHELGHALGLDHNDNPVSIMYPQQNDSLALSTDDLAALRALCKK